MNAHVTFSRPSTLAFALMSCHDLDDHEDVIRAVLAARLCCSEIFDDLDEAIECERTRRELDRRQ